MTNFPLTFRILSEYERELDPLIPRDTHYSKRIDNLKRADFILGTFIDDELVGIVYSRKIFRLINNITWIVHERHRRTGIGRKQTEFFLDNVFQESFITAFCRNEISKSLAKGAGFHFLANFGWWRR